MPMLAFAAVLACSRGDEQPPAGYQGGIAPSAVSGRSPYREVMPASFGRVTGIVDVDGGKTADTTVFPTHDNQVCGDSLSFRTLEYDGGVVGSIVWLEDARTGKVLPLDRRYELLNERCHLLPRTQAVVAGGTLNLRTLDQAEHRIRLVKVPAQTRSIVSLYTSGQVVPVQNMLRNPGRIAVTCDRHPWTHGWVLVFDHPYFETTGAGGGFTIDSVPAGTYRLVAWHGRYGSVEQPVTVTANGEAKATLKFAIAKDTSRRAP